MTIKKRDYEEAKENSISAVKIDVRIDGLCSRERKVAAFTFKTMAVNSIAEKNGKIETLNRAIEEASKVLSAAVKEIIDG